MDFTGDGENAWIELVFHLDVHLIRLTYGSITSLIFSLSSWFSVGFPTWFPQRFR